MVRITEVEHRCVDLGSESSRVSSREAEHWAAARMQLHCARLCEVRAPAGPMPLTVQHVTVWGAQSGDPSYAAPTLNGVLSPDTLARSVLLAIHPWAAYASKQAE